MCPLVTVGVEGSESTGAASAEAAAAPTSVGSRHLFWRVTWQELATFRCGGTCCSFLAVSSGRGDEGATSAWHQCGDGASSVRWSRPVSRSARPASVRAHRAVEEEGCDFPAVAVHVARSTLPASACFRCRLRQRQRQRFWVHCQLRAIPLCVDFAPLHQFPLLFDVRMA